MPSSFQSKIPQHRKHGRPHDKRVHRQPQRHHQDLAIGPREPVPRFERKRHAGDHAEYDQQLLRRNAEPPDLAASRTNPLPSPQIMGEALYQRNQSFLAVAASKIRPHSFNSCAIWLTSLSPRPLRLTITMASLPIFRAFFITYAIACADSNAGMIPSLREQNLAASSASSSVAYVYSMRFKSRR